MRWTGCALQREMPCMTNTHDTDLGKLQMLVLERRDESCNMTRFYVLAIEPMLFGDTALVEEWERIGAMGQRQLELHRGQSAAAEALDDWLSRKSRRR
jgi:predicted DNA-binding WGR domain protein